MQQEYLISKKEKEGEGRAKITIPARFLLHDALRRTEIPYDMLGNFDESTEGALFDFFEEIFDDGPGGIYRSVE